MVLDSIVTGVMVMIISVGDVPVVVVLLCDALGAIVVVTDGVLNFVGVSFAVNLPFVVVIML